MKHCTTGKTRYRDELGAKLALSRTARGNGDRREARVYRCPHCHGWHLTSRA